MAEGFQGVQTGDSGSDAGQELWCSCIDQLAQEMPEQQFNTWIRPLAAVVAADLSKVTVLVGNRFKLDWIRTQYSNRISAALERVYGQSVILDLALAPKEYSTRPSLQKIHSDRERVDEPPDLIEDKALQGQRNRLNASLSFDSLIEGSANRMARAAAMHVSDMPGQLYNPLFIYGGVGLGKTHLMHAVGNRLLANRPSSNVLRW